MRLIDMKTVIEEIEDTITSVSFCGTVEAARSAHETKDRILSRVKDLPTIEAVPIKAISAWLAGYAAPPLYASDHVAALKNKVSIKTETERAEAWEYHWQHLMECGLLQEEQNGTDNP